MQSYKRSKDGVQNLSGVRMLRLLSKVAFTISGHDVRQGVLTGYPTTYPNNGNRALRACPLEQNKRFRTRFRTRRVLNPVTSLDMKDLVMSVEGRQKTHHFEAKFHGQDNGHVRFFIRWVVLEKFEH